MHGERVAVYSDAVIFKIKRLARLQGIRQKARISEIQVSSDHNVATLEPQVIEAIRAFTEVKYESIGSIVGNLDSITIHRGNEFRVWDETIGRPVTCRFPSKMLQEVKEKLGNRVLVHGEVKANFRGEPTVIIVQGFESYPDESTLPTIEEMSGLVDDFTGGVALKDFLEEIRNGG